MMYIYMTFSLDFSLFLTKKMFFKVKCEACVDIDSVEQIDANGSQKLGQNDANQGKKSPNWCILCLEITKRMQNDPNFGVVPN